MARMVPFPMLPTKSTAERRLYEGFLEQLDDAYICYHSVDWVMAGPRGPVEGEADFVIAHPTDGLLVLEVKGGRISYDPSTRTWTTTGRSGTHTLDKDPFRQAQGQLHSLLEILEAQPGWDRWRPSFGHAVAFPDGTYDRAAHPAAPPEIAIDRRHVDSLPTRVRQIMAFHRRPGRRFGGRGDGRRGPRPRVPGRGPHPARARVRRGGQEDAGIAAHLARETAGVPNLDVAHFHALAHRLITEAGIPLPEDVDTGPGSDFFEDRLPELLMEAADRLPLRYDVMVVDEAQDFRDHWWPALLALHADPDEGRLYLFADEGQNLYGGTVPDLIPEDARFPLPANVRNCREIGGFVSVFYRGNRRPRRDLVRPSR